MRGQQGDEEGRGGRRERVLSPRELNRALLARQHLLARVPAADRPDVQAELEHLIGLQSQAPDPPYVALWNRLEGFDPADLAQLLTGRHAVRTALMRSTLFVVTAQDALLLRPLVQPVVLRAMLASWRGRLAGADPAEVARRARPLLEERPRTFEELGSALAGHFPASDPAALGAAARAAMALVQVPPRGLWGAGGPAAHTTVDRWLGVPDPLGQPPDGEAAADVLDGVLRRYLAAYGPASVRDVQAWCGLTGLRAAAGRLADELVRFRADDGTVLLDLPDAPRPGPDAPAPVRLLGGFDVLLLSHADRSRVLDPADKSRVFTVNGIIRPVVLVDGRVAGTWRAPDPAARGGDGPCLVVTLFRPPAPATMQDVVTEAERYLAWAATPGTVRVEVSG